MKGFDGVRVQALSRRVNDHHVRPDAAFFQLQRCLSGVAAEKFRVRFREALEKSGQRGDYDAARWLYVPDFYTEYRYILGTRGEKPLICIGVNPSTAAPDALDPTLQSVQRIALSNGYDSFIMFNVYAQRATRPNDMDAALNEHLHAENMAAFRYVLEASLPRRPAVWAACPNIDGYIIHL